jgi:GTPase Era involved in 16S rRNA processing
MQNSNKVEKSYPKFAVVGHPNKGKSSIVSSLALDDSIQIGDTPGTTQVKRGFPLKVDGKIIYELFDTPGFQRARRVLSWLKKQEPVSADKRTDVVRAFIFEHKNDERFRDEIELLEPIIDGAGIIYVVDASKPYGSEYEVEMEILRWCGQPSMAILNLIGEDDYREQWKSALGHYFRMVRTFNPITSTFYDHISLLESMSQLKEEWTKAIKVAISILEGLQEQKIEQTINVIVSNMKKTLSFVHTQSIKGEKVLPTEDNSSKERYREKIIKYEKSQKRAIEKIWNHKSIEKIEDNLVLDKVGLFSKESASIFGLSEKELILTGASAGAMGGLGIDLLLGGGSFFLGSFIGGAIGGIGAKFGFSNLYEVKLLGKKLGRRELRIGPMQNLNFPYILLGRALYHSSMVAKRSHALRESLSLDEKAFYTEQIIDSIMRKKLEKIHILLRKGDKIDDLLWSEYKHVIQESFIKLM